MNAVRRMGAVGVWSALISLLAALLLPFPASAQSFAPGSGRLLLIGQSNQAAWDDWTQIGGEPEGGSVYYQLSTATFNSGIGGAPIHRTYADFLAGNNKIVQIGVSWKDNPPGWDGNAATHDAAARNATQAVANGTYDSQFQPLIDYINDHPGARFFIRIDYEVSSVFHCTDYGSANMTCASYKDAFNHVANLIDSSNTAPGGNVAFVYHPVRGEFAQLYPGDANVDWIGVSIFNHELCMPIYNQNQYLYNGTPGVGFDNANNLCMGYVLTRDANGNLAAQPHSFAYDFNVLGLLKFAKDHAKPAIFSEAAPMNFAPGQNANGTEDDNTVAAWISRYFGLMNYNGPLPNMEGSYDLSDVVKAAIYMNIDMRYGWDGNYGQSGFQFPYDADWYNNAKLTAYNQAQTAFCNGLSSSGFTTTCGSGGGGGGDTQAPTAPGNLASPARTSGSVSLAWGASTDNIGVTGYNVYQDGALAGSTGSLLFTVIGLSANTAYTFTVRATDAAGNLSPPSGALTVTTSASGGGAVAIPGTVASQAGAIANGSSKSWSVNADVSGNYKFSIVSTSSRNSRLITVTFGGTSIVQAIDAGQTLNVYFSGIPAGAGTFQIQAGSDGVSIGSITAALF